MKREKCKVNDVIFPSGCEARAINLDNKNIEIGIFTGGSSVRSKNIFTAISRYPTGKHETNREYVYSVVVYQKYLTRLRELIIFEPWRENYHFSQPS